MLKVYFKKVRKKNRFEHDSLVRNVHLYVILLIFVFFILKIACQKIVQQRLASSSQCITPTSSRPTTPQGTRLGITSFQTHQHQPHQQQQIHSSPSNGYHPSSSNSNSVSLTSGNNSMQSTNNNNNYTLPHR